MTQLLDKPLFIVASHEDHPDEDTGIFEVHAIVDEYTFLIKLYHSDVIPEALHFVTIDNPALYFTRPQAEAALAALVAERQES
jgi:hypothetical protein